MRFDRKQLQAVLDVARSIAAKGPRLTCPILANVALFPGERSTRVQATNLDLGMSVSLVTLADPGDAAVTVNAAHLYAAVKALPKGQDAVQVIVLDEARWVTVHGTKLPTLAAEDFPSVEGRPARSIPCNGLIQALEQVLPAMATDTSRFNFCCAYLDPAGYVVTTDGHRLHRVARGPFQEPAVKIPDQLARLLVTPKLTRLLEGHLDLGLVPRTRTIDHTSQPGWEGDPIEEVPAGEDIYVPIRGGFLLARAIDAEFPDHEKVIPKGTGKTVLAFPAENLLAHLDHAMGFLRGIRNYPIEFQCYKNKVTIFAKSPDVGQLEIDCPEALYSGAPIRIGFNASYVKAAVTALVGTTVAELHFNTEMAPVRIQDSTGFTSVIMPMRTGRSLPQEEPEVVEEASEAAA